MAHESQEISWSLRVRPILTGVSEVHTIGAPIAPTVLVLAPTEMTKLVEREREWGKQDRQWEEFAFTGITCGLDNVAHMHVGHNVGVSAQLKTQAKARIRQVGRELGGEGKGFRGHEYKRGTRRHALELAKF